ncbi:uncharacterized protein N7506_005523 [Penicillium brevicompactum]|uniref:uncharacterized protein n=1 Tax=Penicillium brevicompactum TaxID=5074 RepID=UPI00253FF3EA|nr:uncharacterized protein N7506_005523 [Penicillium brevicompactum]KAJ5337501.1 hypothetical protein N7506_005523 [Penicillium brevicompactum]
MLGKWVNDDSSCESGRFHRFLSLARTAPPSSKCNFNVLPGLPGKSHLHPSSLSFLRYRIGGHGILIEPHGPRNISQHARRPLGHDIMAPAPSQRQLAAISVTERVCSSISLIGTFIIITSFICSRSFRKPINRLVFYASWGNMMANIATMISQSGIHAGARSPLCQVQAFLIQCPLWCWVALPWDYLRIAVFYGPVWFVIFLTFAIYLRAGSVIYKKHRELRNLSGIESLGSDTQPDGPLVTHAGIQITSEIACFVPVHRSLSARDVPTRSFTASSFTPCSIPPEGGPIDSFSMLQNLEESSSPIQDSCRPWPDPRPLRAEVSAKAARHECGDSYTQRRKAIEASCAAWAYTKYAMLFFIALLVTWVPSTVNRVYAFARPDDYSFGLFYASSFVLPLQGFWNSLIYVSISWPAFKTLWRDLRSRSTGLRNI